MREGKQWKEKQGRGRTSGKEKREKVGMRKGRRGGKWRRRGTRPSRRKGGKERREKVERRKEGKGREGEAGGGRRPRRRKGRRGGKK